MRENRLRWDGPDEIRKNNEIVTRISEIWCKKLGEHVNREKN